MDVLHGKIIIIGLDPVYDSAGCSEEDVTDQVHVIDCGGDGERTMCGIDVVCGAIFTNTKKPVSCHTCLSGVKYYKSIKIGRG